MVARCNKVGVAIYADAVFNHMAAGSGQGMAGSSFSSRSFPAVPYTPDDFHHNPGDTGSNCAVTDFKNQTNVQECDLVGLPDLDTSSPKVQQTIGAMLKDLASLGVGGFRVDAAKHQEAGQLGAVLRDGPGLYGFMEVIEGAGEAVQPPMYYSDGQVTEFDFSAQLCDKVKNEGQLGQLAQFSASGWNLVPSENAVVFIDNHDSQRGSAGLTYKDGALYILANVFMLATPYGYPKVMSSYSFSDHDQGPPSTPVHSGGSSVACGLNQPWICEHRFPQIAGMVAFRKAVGDSPVVNTATGNNNDAIAFGRGGQGFVLINRGQGTWTATLDTGLKAGTYNDLLGVLSNPITVGSDGKANFEIPSLRAVALAVQS